jgi:uncharacterized protein (DUF1684 family)
MKKHICLLFPLALALTGCDKTQPVKLDRAAAEATVKAIEKDRADTKEWLRRSPMSYLAAIDRIDFNGKRSLTVGSAADNDVRLAASDIESHHLRVTVDGDRFRIEGVDANARFKIKDEVKREATVDPSAIRIGRFTLRLSHQRFPAIIVFDPQSPHFKEYKGLAYFSIDPSYRFEIPLIRDPKPERIIIMSTRGNRRSAECVGWVNFLVGTTSCRLEVTRLLEPGSGENEMAVFFRDATSGKESYPLGRYVDLKKLDSGKYVLDFNQAYNPACAFSKFYNCPIPPKSNTLQVAIRAGEMDSHYH